MIVSRKAGDLIVPIKSVHRKKYTQVGKNIYPTILLVRALLVRVLLA